MSYIQELIDLFHKHLNEISPRPEQATHFTYYKNPYSNYMVRWCKLDDKGRWWVWVKPKWVKTIIPSHINVIKVCKPKP